MKDLIIIGGGFWGTAIYLKAKEAGMSCQVMDEGHTQSGSRNAGALTCKRWYKSDTIRKHVPETWTYEAILKWIEWLEQEEHIRKVGQWTYNKNRDTWKRNDDCYITSEINSILKLAKPTYRTVRRVTSHKKHCKLHLADGSTMQAHDVVIAAGMWTDRILERSELKPIGSRGLMGRAMMLRAMPRALRLRCPDWKGEVATVIVRPYKNFDLLPTNDASWYFGVTTEKKESENAWSELAEAATHLVGDNANVIREIRGYRAVCEDGMARVQYVDHHCHIIAACGGQKVGLGLAGAAADNVVELLRSGW